MAPIATFLLILNAQLAHNQYIHRQSQLLPDFVHYQGMLPLGNARIIASVCLCSV